MTATDVGKTALVGWRQRAADGLATPVSERTPLDEDQVRAVLGAVFFGLSLYYVVGTVRRAVSETR